MTSEIAIQVENISKIYKLYDKPADRLKESIHPLGKKFHKDFHAVQNISFKINKGETLGIIGKNGSGKSTLLKMITGVLNPTAGRITVNGKISALLELGAGFNPEYTGLENIYLNGIIMGYTREEMDRKLDDILSFADIGDFISQPVKIYSSGMFVRLAFAVAINVDPEILIIDEALSVGDMRFQQKCFRKIDEFKDSKTILFVSHDLTVINKYCNRAIWINEGQLLEDGTPEAIAKKYQAFMLGSNLTKYSNVISNGDSSKTNNTVAPIPDNLDVLGDNQARITGVSLLDNQTDELINIVSPNQWVKLLIRIKSNCNLYDPIVGFSLKDRLGNIVTESNSYVLERQIDVLQDGESYVFGFVFQFPTLSRGMYSISPAVASGTQEDHHQHSWVHDAIVIHVMDMRKYNLNGYMALNEIEFYQFD